MLSPKSSALVAGLDDSLFNAESLFNTFDGLLKLLGYNESGNFYVPFTELLGCELTAIT